MTKEGKPELKPSQLDPKSGFMTPTLQARVSYSGKDVIISKCQLHAYRGPGAVLQ